MEYPRWIQAFWGPQHCFFEAFKIKWSRLANPHIGDVDTNMQPKDNKVIADN